MERLDTAENNLKDLEAKVIKKKASENQVNDARRTRDEAASDLESFKEATLRSALTKLTKAYCEMYQNSLQQMNSQLAALSSSSTQLQTPYKQLPQPTYSTPIAYPH